MKDFHKDYYTGVKRVYFNKILKTIINIGNLNKRNIKILDFGCGIGKLKKILGGKVIGYDVLQDLSDIKDWKKEKFDVVVVNEVFYLFSNKELRDFLSDLYKINPQAELIVGISKQTILNRIAAILGGELDAHSDTKLLPKQQIKIISEKMRILKKRTVFFLCNVFLLKFK